MKKQNLDPMLYAMLANKAPPAEAMGPLLERTDWAGLERQRNILSSHNRYVSSPELTSLIHWLDAMLLAATHDGYISPPFTKETP